MTYEPCLSDYGVISSKGIAARLIQIGTFSLFNHVVIKADGDFVYEAKPSGIKKSPLSDYAEFTIAWNKHEQDFSDHQRAMARDFYESQLGKPYNFGVFFLLGLRCVGLRLPRLLRLPLAKMNGYVCSEFAVAGYKASGFTQFEKEDWEYTPAMMANRLIYL